MQSLKRAHRRFFTRRRSNPESGTTDERAICGIRELSDRLSSTITRRLVSLGTFTKGDRGAVDNGDLAKDNFETEEGRAALSLSLLRIMQGQSVPGLDNPTQTLRDIGLLVANRDGRRVHTHSRGRTQRCDFIAV